MQPTITKLEATAQAFKQYGLGGVGLREVEILVALGLTGRQARVYLALLKTSHGRAKAVADVSLVNSQEIYRVIDSLQQRGIVQRNVTAPTTFTAAPLTDVVKELLAQKTNELNTIRQKTKHLTKRLQLYPITVSAEKPCLGTVFEGDRGKKHRNAIQESCQEVDAVTTWKQFRQLTTLYETQLQHALKKNITIRIITEKPPNQPLPNWIKNNQTKTAQSHLQLKILPNPSTATLTIFDNTQAAIALNNTITYTKGPHLWTNNPTITSN